MTEIEVDENTPSHWVASAGDLVIVLAFAGSHEDVAHVAAAARVIERVHRARRAPVRFLFVAPPVLSRAPTADVRAAILRASQKLEESVGRACLVVLGTGFGPALHRGAATGLIAILRPKTRWEIHVDLAPALGFLLGASHPELAQIMERCAAELRARADASTDAARRDERDR